MGWDDNLDRQSPAYGIASAAERFVRVVAGPGTGKSFALRRRVAASTREEMGQIAHPPPHLANRRHQRPHAAYIPKRARYSSISMEHRTIIRLTVETTWPNRTH